MYFIDPSSIYFVFFSVFITNRNFCSNKWTHVEWGRGERVWAGCPRQKPWEFGGIATLLKGTLVILEGFWSATEMSKNFPPLRLGYRCPSGSTQYTQVYFYVTGITSGTLLAKVDINNIVHEVFCMPCFCHDWLSDGNKSKRKPNKPPTTEKQEYHW